MPIYEYKCDDCGSCFEELVMGEPVRVACPRCGSSSTEKVISTFRRGRAHSDSAPISRGSSSSSSNACSGCAGGSCSTCK